MFTLNKLLRNNIRDLTPYSSARDEYSGEGAVFLDANENPFDTGVNRYPDPLQLKLKVELAKIKNTHYENIFLGNGSDEAIDLLYRAFCEPGTDNVVAIKPSYGMYKVCADINNVEYRESMLKKDFQVDVPGLLDSIDEQTKLIFLCSPNNPTSNNLCTEDVIAILEQFNGLVIIDEAYIDFSQSTGFMSELENYPNLVVLQTLSKAWGMAGIRLGMAMASREIIQVLNRIKYPYNVNVLTQKFALEQLNKEAEKEAWVKEIIAERDRLRVELSKMDIVSEILPSDANFLMVRFKDSNKVFHYLIDRKIIVRDRSKVALCEGCLRLTVGTAEENKSLLKALEAYLKQ